MIESSKKTGPWRERVALAGGELDVDSTPGQGTALRFSLPG